MTLDRRFMSKVDTSGDCWLWTARLDKDGYGRYRVGSSLQQAHRVAALENGPIPDGYEVDHLYGVRRCVKPEHLEAVTRTVNNQRRITGSCRKGHPMRQYRDRRICPTCIAETQRRYRERQKEMA